MIQSLKRFQKMPSIFMHKTVSITNLFFLENHDQKEDNLTNKACQRYIIYNAIIWQKNYETQTSSKQLTENIKHK